MPSLTLLGVMGDTILRMCSASAEACLKGNVFLFSLSGTAVKSNRRRTAGVLIANPDSFHSISPNLVDDWGGGGGGEMKAVLMSTLARELVPQIHRQGHQGHAKT